MEEKNEEKVTLWVNAKDMLLLALNKESLQDALDFLEEKLRMNDLGEPKRIVAIDALRGKKGTTTSPKSGTWTDYSTDST